MPAKPKGFVTCYICQREFGSRSLAFHEPQCLQKWKNENNRLHPSQRGPIPRKNDEYRQPESPDEETIMRHVNGRHPAITAANRAKFERRPRTATLTHPKILDIGDVNRVDMTQECSNRQRPTTFTRNRPTPNLKNVPTVLRRTNGNNHNYTAPSPSLTGSTVVADQTHKSPPQDRNGYTPKRVHLTENHNTNREQMSPLKSSNSTESLPYSSKFSTTSGESSADDIDLKYGRIKSFLPKPVVNYHADNHHPRALQYSPEVTTPPTPQPPPEPCQSCRIANLGGAGIAKSSLERLHSHPKKPTSTMVQHRGTGHSQGQRRLEERSGPVHQTGNVVARISGLHGPERNANGIKKFFNSDERYENEQTDVPSRYSNQSPNSNGTNLVTCPICDRKFSSKVFVSHHSNCLQKLHQDNGKDTTQSPATITTAKVATSILSEQTGQCSAQTGRGSAQTGHVRKGPPTSRSLPPGLLPSRVCQSQTQQDQITTKASEDQENVEQVSPRSSGFQAPRFAICYICGREFGSKSIVIHEPQCLKKWNLENEKLPKRLRRTEPQKPEPMLNSDGTIDLEGLADASWKSHLNQLVPCAKCHRTFNPDRLDVHRRVCRVVKNEPNMSTK